MKNMKNFKIGEITDKVWCGDFVTECLFLQKFRDGSMHFYDLTCKCYRRATWDINHDNEIILNGWNSHKNPIVLD